MRVLVSQLSTVGREVRATTMQWAYEGKKLDAAVKHMSWVPPWVDALIAGNEPIGRRFLGSDSTLVEDCVGLGRHPSLWWTMNCHYNAAYDVQRLNVKSKLKHEAVDERGTGDKTERFMFVKGNSDLVAQMLALRTELLMRVVMPAIVPHSEEAPFMSMARFETGPGGNAHYHGFNVGTPGPQVLRVKANVEGDGDEAPQTVRFCLLYTSPSPRDS